MTIQSDLQMLKERVEVVDRKVDANREKELAEHEGINARINAIVSEISGRLWQVGGSVIGAVILAALAQKFG